MLQKNLDKLDVSCVSGSFGLRWVVRHVQHLISVLVDVNRKLGLRHLGSSLTDIVCRKPNVNRTSYFLGLRRSKGNVGARESAGFVL